MKVKELIKELQKFGDNEEVYTEGCDCIGGTYGVTVYEEKDYVEEVDGPGIVIRRSSGRLGQYYMDNIHRKRRNNE